MERGTSTSSTGGTGCAGGDNQHRGLRTSRCQALPQWRSGGSAVPTKTRIPIGKLFRQLASQGGIGQSGRLLGRRDLRGPREATPPGSATAELQHELESKAAERDIPAGATKASSSAPAAPGEVPSTPRPTAPGWKRSTTTCHGRTQPGLGSGGAPERPLNVDGVTTVTQRRKSSRKGRNRILLKAGSAAEPSEGTRPGDAGFDTTMVRRTHRPPEALGAREDAQPRPEADWEPPPPSDLGERCRTGP